MRSRLALLVFFGLVASPLPSNAQDSEPPGSTAEAPPSAADEPGEPRVEPLPEAPPPTVPSAPSAPSARGVGGRDALDEYLSRSMELRYEPGMFTTFEVYQGGAPIELGFFGGGYEEIFAGSPDAIESMETYQLLRAIGIPLWFAGVAVLTAEIVLLMLDAFGDGEKILVDSGGPTTLFWGLTISSFAVSAVGTTLIQAAPSQLDDAVIYYNRDLVLELRGQRAELPRLPSLRLTMSF